MLVAICRYQLFQKLRAPPKTVRRLQMMEAIKGYLVQFSRFWENRVLNKESRIDQEVMRPSRLLAPLRKEDQ